MIVANRVIYIKLGQGGKWEQECIEERQTVRLGYYYGEHLFELCLAGRWDAVEEALRERHREWVAREHVKHLRLFYEADSGAVWITFYSNRLWWCRAESEVVLVPNEKDREDPVVQERRVLGKWSCEDLEGNDLDFSRLSGKLLALRSYRWTTAELLPELAKYAVLKINGGVPQSAQAATDARTALVGATAEAIRSLHPGDFEILVDLVFRQAGWNRMSEVGGVQKTIDLDLQMPITNRRCAVQVKSRIGGPDLMKRIESLVALEYDDKYLVVHSPEGKIPESAADMGVKIIRANGLAEWCVGLGLVDWVVNKAC